MSNEDVLKDAVYLNLSQEQIEQKLKSSFTKNKDYDEEIEIEVKKPLSTILKSENTIIVALVMIIAILIGVTIYIW